MPGDDHHVQVLLNGQPVGEARWDGLAPFDLGVAVPAGSVLEGDNVVELKALLDGGVSESLFYVDSFDLMYERGYQAVEDALTFTAANGTDVAVGGFSQPGVMVFDVTLPARPVLMTDYAVSLAGDGRYEVRFGAAGASETLRYQALLPGRAKSPTRVAAWQDTGLRRETNAADYVLVAPESLKEAARSLAEHRNNLGRATMVVGLEDIYDEFNAGIAEPAAIRTFLSHATSRWSTPPRYVTLVGRGTWDYRDLRGFGDNLVPTLLVDSPDGLNASDVAYADLAGNDGIPEVAIGRLPVLTAQDLLDYVAKIQAHESAASGEWQRHVLLTADNADAAGNFPADSESMAALLPPDYTAGRVHLDTTTAAAGRLAILQGVNDGVVVFNYIGHGGFDRLADENLFTSADVASLNNAGRLPVFLAMTCSVGDFAQPGYPSLGEAMLLRKDGGAFAVWAPSGLSQNSLGGAAGSELLPRRVRGRREGRRRPRRAGDPGAGHPGLAVHALHVQPARRAREPAPRLASGARAGEAGRDSAAAPGGPAARRHARPAGSDRPQHVALHPKRRRRDDRASLGPPPRAGRGRRAGARGAPPGASPRGLGPRPGALPRRRGGRRGSGGVARRPARAGHARRAGRPARAAGPGHRAAADRLAVPGRPPARPGPAEGANSPLSTFDSPLFWESIACPLGLYEWTRVPPLPILIDVTFRDRLIATIRAARPVLESLGVLVVGSRVPNLLEERATAVRRAPRSGRPGGAVTAVQERRLRELRSRVLVRAFDHRQRRHARGVWFRLRRVLALAREAYAVPSRRGIAS